MTSARTRVECRAFLTEISELPCCTNKNDNSLCQPDTGIARVVVDILSESHVNAKDWCKAGVDLNSPFVLPLDNECPLAGKPQYCCRKSKHKLSSSIASILDKTHSASSVASVIALENPSSPGTMLVDVSLICCALLALFHYKQCYLVLI